MREEQADRDSTIAGLPQGLGKAAAEHGPGGNWKQSAVAAPM